MTGIAMRVIRQMRGDKRTLALILFAPLLMFTLIFFLLSDSDYTPTIAAQTSALPQQIVTPRSSKENVHLVNLADYTYTSESQLLIDHKNIDLVLTRNGMKLDTYILETSLKSGQAFKSPAKRHGGDAPGRHHPIARRV